MITKHCSEIFHKANFLKWLGAELIYAHEGECIIQLPLTEAHQQQDGFIHAGVQATIADHCCGTAVGSLLSETRIPLTIEFKINYLRPATGNLLTGKARVIRHGKIISVAECDILISGDGGEKLTAKMVATLTTVER